MNDRAPSEMAATLRRLLDQRGLTLGNHALAQAVPGLIREHRQARQAEEAARSTRDLGG